MTWTDYLGLESLTLAFYATIEGCPYVFSSARLYDPDGNQIETSGDYEVKSGSLRASGILQSLGEQFDQKNGVASPRSLSLTLCPGDVDFAADKDVEWLQGLFATESADGVITHLTADITGGTDTTWEVKSTTGFVNTMNVWLSPGNSCANVTTGSTATVLNIANFGKFGSTSRKFSATEGVQGVIGSRVYVSNFIRTWKDREVRVYMTFADMHGRIVASDLFTDDSVTIFRGHIKTTPEVGAEVVFSCIGLEERCNEMIAAHLAKSSLSFNAAPGTYYPLEGELSQGLAGKPGAFFISDNNRIPVVVTEKRWDYATLSWVVLNQVRLDGIANPAPYLYDGSAEVKNTILTFGLLWSYLAQGLDLVSWVGTWGFANPGGVSISFQESLTIILGYGTSASPGWGANKGLTQLIWDGSLVTETGPPKYTYAYDVEFLWDHDRSVGPVLGLLENDLFVPHPADVTASSIWCPKLTRKGDVPAPAIYIPANSSSILVQDPRVGEAEFSSSGHVVFGEAILSYSGISAATYKTGEAIDGVSILTGLQVVRGKRKTISVAFSDEFLEGASSYSQVYAELEAGPYKETPEAIEVRQVIYLRDTLAEIILTLATSIDGDGHNGTRDTIAGRNGAGLRDDQIHALQLGLLTNDAVWWKGEKEIIIYQPVKFSEWLENIAKLTGGVFGAILAPVSVSSWDLRLGFAQIAQPSEAIFALDVGPDELEERPPAVRVSRGAAQPLKTITAQPEFDPIKGEAAGLPQTWVSPQIAGDRTAGAMELYNPDCLMKALEFTIRWTPMAKAILELHGDSVRTFHLRVRTPRIWRLTPGQTIRLTSVWPPNPTRSRMGLEARHLVIVSIARFYWSNNGLTAEVQAVDFDQLFRRTNYSPALLVSSYNSGTQEITVEAYNYVGQYADNPSDPGVVAVDTYPYEGRVSKVRVYEAGDWSNGAQRSASCVSGLLTHDGAALSAGLQSAISGGAEVIVEFDVYSALGAPQTHQKSWAWISDGTVIGASSDKPFVLAA